MKLFLMLIVFSMSTTVLAQSTVIKRKDNGELFYSYEEAVIRALLAANKTKCVFKPGTKETSERSWSISQMIGYSDELMVTDGVQPLLIFTNARTIYSDVDTIKITITTSSDYKVITGVLVQPFRKIRVNTGDLKNPKMGDAWELIQEAVCSI